MALKLFVKRIIIILLLFAVLGGGILLFIRYSMYDFVIIEEVISPDNKHVAIIFEANSGATSKFVYRLSILENGKAINKWSNGNTYISYGEFSVKWADEKTLLVDNNAAECFKQKSKVNGITIIYDYVDKK